MGYSKYQFDSSLAPHENSTNLGSRGNANAIPAEDTLEDQITPLPIVSRQRSRRHAHTPSVVSVHTEGEMHALAEFMAGFADTPKSSVGAPMRVSDASNTNTSTKVIPRTRSNTVSSLDSTAPSVVSTYTSTTSDSDHQYSQSADGHTRPEPTNHYTRSRPPRISTDIHRSTPSLMSTPSLTSSASYSSLSTGRYTSPITPGTSSSELPVYSDLAIIDERHPDDNDRLRHPNIEDPLEYRIRTGDMAWPEQKQKDSNIIWATSRTVAPTNVVPLTSTFETDVSPPTSPSPRLPPTPRSAGMGTFSRFLLSRTRKQSSGAEQDIYAEEKRAKKEDSKAKKENARLEKLVAAGPTTVGKMMGLS